MCDQERQAKVDKIREDVSSEVLLSWALHCLDEKQGQDVVCIHAAPVTTIADYIVLCTATSSTQLRVLADTIRRVQRKLGYELLNSGQPDDDTWTILDYGSVVVHLFSKEGRVHYHMEDMYKEAELMDLEKLMQEYPCEIQETLQGI